MARIIYGVGAKYDSGTGHLNTLLNALRITDMSLSVEEDEIDITQLVGSEADADVWMQRMTGMRTGTLSFNGFYPKTATVIGAAGSVSGTGLLASATDWKLDVDYGEQEVTNFAGSDTWREYIPSGTCNWSGSANCQVGTGDSWSDPDAPNERSGAAFSLAASGLTLSGNAITTSVSQSFRPMDKVVRAVSFQGIGQVSVSDSIIPVGIPAIDRDASPKSPAVQIQIKAAIGAGTAEKKRYWGFLRQVSFDASPSEPLKVSGSIRLMDSVTVI
jgi:hypothetical protein